MTRSDAYLAWLGTLDEQTRDLVQTVMAFVGVQIDSRFNDLAGDVQRIERRQGKNITRVDELQLRLDQYENRQWIAAKEAIEQFAATQLPIDERDALIQLIYQLVADVEALKAKQAGDASK